MKSNDIKQVLAEICKAKARLGALYGQLKEAETDYMTHMRSNIELALQVARSKVNTREYKKDYTKLTDEYLRCSDIYTKILLQKEYLEELIKHYEQLRKQDKQSDDSNTEKSTN